jgi:hypothetical protein
MKQVTITTIVLLTILFVSAFYLSRETKDRKIVKYTVPIKNVNDILQRGYERYVENIDEYRIGVPLSGYNNPNSPFSNSYISHPVSFIPGYRQPLDGIVPGDYPSTLDASNVMFASTASDCKYDCMDMTNDYYSDMLN